MAPSAVSNGQTMSNGNNGVSVKSIQIKDRKIVASNRTLQGEEHHKEVLANFRCLVADLCQQFNGGHPGGAMSMAAIGTALWAHTMRYSPRNPSWFNRDRFVLSNGHCCLFQYMFLHLTGYADMTWDQLKSYHSVLPDSLCPGHPEIEIQGVEVTTGPLGQGIANAVGLAMATQHLAAVYNRPGYDVISNTTFCTVGDACLQEGVALEAISLAGHWRLRNLIVLYDNNQITCDGSVDMVCNDDVNAKMEACGWDVIDIDDGCYDVRGIVDAIDWAKAKPHDKPTFINCRTIIGIGSRAQGNATTHGAAFGADDVAHIKRFFGKDPEKHFDFSATSSAFFAHLPERGAELEASWNTLLDTYTSKHPDLAAELKQRMAGEIVGDWESMLPSNFSSSPLPGRKSAGLMLNALAQHSPTFMVGTADLTPSVCMAWPDKEDFQHPALRTSSGPNGSYAGRYIHFGIREHAMSSISNGLAAFHPGTIVPVTSSFFMFYLYAAPGLRMAALQALPQLHVGTHDSIGTGEDGPTHQPIELAALFRAMPNFLYMRPADSEEAAGCVRAALKRLRTPSMLSVSRQANPQYPGSSSREGAEKGGYVFGEDDAAEVTLVGVGAELRFAVETRDALASRGVAARLVSMPCQRVFDVQPKEYRRRVFKDWTLPVVVVEAYALTGWEKYADAGYGMTNSFGRSLPGKQAYEYFGFAGEHIAPRVMEVVEDVRREGLGCLRGEFRELNKEVYEKGFHHA